ncbi:Vi polysaccharide biosynthesis UDP-N-acetylglucosamine C-6 dehydrogenase TviB [Pyruvatibacter mobilis]|uniref:Vi polysaccharide biosynthesis UDP-N-acetylglucosamine C-6 dehydrogenase TviB n=1 Tax=Pyruvatibacter mobilis TaxID=1712261 RepID=A0A845Q851_9HYPH|nr:Vi polysaccharide biosynthesis UDP-N-acetylglucosamine C-6 dehydrogenase TviB [Pyruvatibacter mobilis]NBG94410.1 Vi polysaccharide biosynthesis UDP-N-acetylglucosamine C-6 dehydrogenase TviB [Pyruvatibacter mobilis]QJD76694.1 Vi polysaccharide biosynthesis UDP-N-acetylglucosamine C-6 dehydrogenase TviB [Pyruvatibacter mobilis]
MKNINALRIAVIGIGYVGLPVAVEFGKKQPTIGFDANPARVAELSKGNDETLEVSAEELAEAAQLTFSCEAESLQDADVYIVTVPTPIDDFKRPDLSYLERASETVGKTLKPGNVVIYESTVFPGATEDHCVPVLERVSGLAFNTDFFVGYSPERINPGDKQHRLPDIKKVTSGSTAETAELVDALYASIVRAGTFKASSIRVAEAAKVIENTQRDVNIALINELAILFSKMGINTEEVLNAAGTKWNFLPFRPGLVGGHCIGVDPYYLTHKAQELNHHPEMILAGRRINDSMGSYAGAKVLDAMMLKGLPIHGGRVLMLGLTFKENCPDLRNTRVVDVIAHLRDRQVTVDIHDPWVSADEARHEYGLEMISEPQKGDYDAVVVAVAHDQFREMGPQRIRDYLKPAGVLADLKWVFAAAETDVRL